MNEKIMLAFILNVASSLILYGGSVMGLKISTDKKDAIYQCGENAVFRIATDKEFAPEIKKNGIIDVVCEKDRGLTIKHLALKADSLPQQLTITLDVPGFIDCQATLAHGNQTYKVVAGAAFEPLKIESETVAPTDFMRFWEDGKAELAAIPVDAQLAPLSQYSDARQKSYELSLANIEGARFYAYLSVPVKDTPNETFPIYLVIPGYGVGNCSLPQSAFAAEHKTIAAFASVHDIGLGLPEAKYEELKNGPLKGYDLRGIPDKRKYFFRKVVLGLNRLVDYLAAMPEADAKRIIVEGSSQGGGLGLMLCGINHKITGVIANVPAFCDHWGYLAGRSAGWPEFSRRVNSAIKDETLNMSAYFDCVVFANYIKCSTLIGVGFIDDSCSPSSVFACYNALKHEKQIVMAPEQGHSYLILSQSQERNRWLSDKLGVKMK